MYSIFLGEIGTVNHLSIPDEWCAPHTVYKLTVVEDTFGSAAALERNHVPEISERSSAVPTESLDATTNI